MPSRQPILDLMAAIEFDGLSDDGDDDEGVDDDDDDENSGAIRRERQNATEVTYFRRIHIVGPQPQDTSRSLCGLNGKALNRDFKTMPGMLSCAAFYQII